MDSVLGSEVGRSLDLDLVVTMLDRAEALAEPSSDTLEKSEAVPFQGALVGNEHRLCPAYLLVHPAQPSNGLEELGPAVQWNHARRRGRLGNGKRRQQLFFLTGESSAPSSASISCASSGYQVPSGRHCSNARLKERSSSSESPREVGPAGAFCGSTFARTSAFHASRYHASSSATWVLTWGISFSTWEWDSLITRADKASVLILTCEVRRARARGSVAFGCLPVAVPVHVGDHGGHPSDPRQIRCRQGDGKPQNHEVKLATVGGHADVQLVGFRGFGDRRVRRGQGALCVSVILVRILPQQAFLHQGPGDGFKKGAVRAKCITKRHEPRRLKPAAARGKSCLQPGQEISGHIAHSSEYMTGGLPLLRHEQCEPVLEELGLFPQPDSAGLQEQEIRHLGIQGHAPSAFSHHAHDLVDGDF